jgi:5'-phosphate synthase pdxT subunit
MGEPLVGVLALQGAFEEHAVALQKTGRPVRVELVRTAEEVSRCDALVLPGGESTAMRKIGVDSEDDILGILSNAVRRIPVFGTCAGCILLAGQVALDVDPDAPSAAEWSPGILTKDEGADVPMPISVCRNFFGRQLASFETTVEGEGAFADFCGVFIRAPGIMLPGEAKVLATIKHPKSEKPHIVAVEQGDRLACTFHPELTDDTRIHAYFLDKVLARASK